MGKKTVIQVYKLEGKKKTQAPTPTPGVKNSIKLLDGVNSKKFGGDKK